MALGREDTGPPPPVPTGGSGLERRLLETERRAATAEAALQQIRSEAERRLADARDAIGREREGRLAAERELGDPSIATPAESYVEVPPQPAVESQPVVEPQAVAEPQPEAEPQPQPVAEAAPAPMPEAEPVTEAEYEHPAETASGETAPPIRSDGASDDDGEGAWPTPWLEPDRSKRRRRRPFGRTPSA